MQAKSRLDASLLSNLLRCRPQISIASACLTVKTRSFPPKTPTRDPNHEKYERLLVWSATAAVLISHLLPVD